MKEEFLSSKLIGMEVERVLDNMKNHSYIDYRTMKVKWDEMFENGWSSEVGGLLWL